MLRSFDDWEAESFAFRADDAPQALTRVAVPADTVAGGPAVTIPDAHLMFTADYSRAGADLVLRGEDGTVFVVDDYFAGDQRARLLSPEGASLSPDVVAALAGPLAPGQYAQAGANPPAAQAIGRVAAVDGNVTIMRNGVAITPSRGDAILEGDVLLTGAGSIGVTFNDGSTLNLTANSRLLVNEFVYDPQGASNSQILDLVQGSLTFISGEVAHSGNMKIGTPVATMGIRGTVGGVTTASDGTVSFYIVQSERGAVLTDSNGTVIAEVMQNGPLIVVRPVGPLEVLAQEVQKSPEQLAAELAALQYIVSVKSIGDQIIRQFFQPDPDAHPHTQFQINLIPGPSDPAGGGGDVIPIDSATIVIPPNDGTPNPLTPGFEIEIPIPPNLPPIVFGPGSATVSEEGLPGGIPDQVGNPDTTNSATATGTIAASDPEGDPLTFTLGNPGAVLTSNGVAVTWEGIGTGTLTGKAGAATIITITIDQSGAYTVTLAGPVDHPATDEQDITAFNVPVHVSDGNSTTTTTLSVTIEDDSPVAVDYSQAVPVGVAALSVNMVIILDVSGSMAGSNITLAKQALQNLLNTNDVQVNQVMVVAFAGNSNVHTISGNPWADAASANTFIQGLGTGGLTNYSAAIDSVMSNWGLGPTSADQTLVYFISDGAPTFGQGLDEAATAVWENFLADNNVDISYAIGISTSVNDPDLAPIAWAPGNPGLLPIILEDALGLDDTLQGTVPSAVTRNIFDDGAELGADGGRILSITVDDVTYTWNGNNTITKTGAAVGTLTGVMITVEATALGGKFEFHFAASEERAAGDWSYTPPDEVDETSEEVFHYILVDNDGDQSGANITLTVGNEPVAVDDNVITNFAAGTPFSIPALALTANDIDPDNDALSVTGVNSESEAVAVTHSVDAVTVSIPGGNGTFEYTVSDGHFSGTGQVEVTHVATADLVGTDGADILIGNDNGTLIEGGKGDDVLIGNGGADTFVFKPGDGNDVIVDFSGHWEGGDGDAILLDNFIFTEFADLIIQGLDLGDGVHDTRIDLGGGDSILLKNVLHTELSAADFLFTEQIC